MRKLKTRGGQSIKDGINSANVRSDWKKLWHLRNFVASSSKRNCWRTERGDSRTPRLRPRGGSRRRGRPLRRPRPKTRTPTTFGAVCLRRWWPSCCWGTPWLVAPFEPENTNIEEKTEDTKVLKWAYLLKHSLRIRHSTRFLVSSGSIDGGQILASGRQLVHGNHGVRRLLAAQLQHRKQVERRRTHICQSANLI